MATSLRPSGIAAVGELPWGSHFCQFYGERVDLVDSLVPYFKAGLENNEQCLWVTSDPFRAEDARTMLRTAVPDLEQRIEHGQIDIIDHGEWYTRAGELTAEQVLKGWIAREDRALSQGYAGLRLTGNTYWLERKDWEGFVDYEARVTETFQSHNILGLCSYCLGKCDSRDVVDVVRNHQFALIRRSGEWELIESAPLKTAKTELRKLNAELEARVHSRTAELQQALRIREEFLSVASHELKTPITSLQLYVDGLLRAYQQRAMPTEEATRRLGKAKEQCSRLEKLINSMLDVSRASSGALPMELDRVDLAEVVRNVADRFTEDVARVGSCLQVDLPVPVIGTWDRLRLDQVVTNLVSNAIKYAPGSTIELSLREVDQQAELVVKDGGPGIPEQDQRRIFEQFVQIAPKSHAGGFGLGLWIVRQILEAHDGSIRVSSLPGEGAMFTVTLPLGASSSN